MEAPLKQRLIGATVLAAIALIFIPMLLKSPEVKDSDSADVPLQIPAEADADGIKTIDIPLDGSSPIVSDALPPKPSTASVPAGPAINTLDIPPNAEPEPDAKPLETAAVAAGQYALVISAKSDADAKSIVSALQSQNLTGKIQSNGQLFRVRIGPFSSRELAELARLRSTAVVTGGTVVAMDAAPTPISASATVAKLEPTMPATATSATAVKPVPAPVTAKPATQTTVPAPSTDAMASAKGFAVQIGAPASQLAASGLRDKALAAGFNSFIQPVDTETGRRYRVRIGPVHNRDEAKQLLASAKQKLGIDGIVVLHP